MTLPPPLEGGYQLWYYYPSIPGSIVVAVIFGLLSAAHIGGVFRTGKKFCLPFAIGGVFEVIGYAFRIVSHSKPTSTTPYAIQALLILLAPILFAASTYMCLGRTIAGVRGGERLSLIKPRWLTRLFVTGDVLCFLIQAGGGGMLATAKDAAATATGQHIILGGLILQIIIFFVFVLVAITFHMRMVRAGSTTAESSGSELAWARKLLVSLYAISFLIMLRNIIRAVEYATSSDGYLLRHEWVIFVFDGACMIMVLIIGLLWYRSHKSLHPPPVVMDEEAYRMVDHKRHELEHK